MLKPLSVVVVFYVVIKVNCLKPNSGYCDGCRNFEYPRFNRPKYYSNSPYKIPKSPYGPSFRGQYSHPPPGYAANNIGQLLSANTRPYKVSKMPTDIGLEDEDIQSLVNYLSKKDLDKVIELALDKEGLSDKYKASTNNVDVNPMGLSHNDNNIFHINSDPNENLEYVTDPNYSSFEKNTLTNIEYGSPTINYPNYYQSVQPAKNVYSQTYIDGEASRYNDQMSLLDAYIQREISEMNPDKANIFTDSRTIEEEHLLKPVNLREYDYDTSYTNKVQSVVKPETAYKLENFADLPLMEYHNSKLETVNSYSVPHYSVIPVLNMQTSQPQPQSTYMSPDSPSPASSSLTSSSILSLINAPEIEPAPPASVAKDQGDAHLKAIKIWTHQSKGTAYTLHEDGTLSLEKPSRSRYKFP